MPVPTWTVGEVLAAADVNTWFVLLSAVATSDQSITNNTAGVNDNALALAVAASSTYQVDLYIRCNGPSSNSFACEFTAPAGSALSASTAAAGTQDIPLSVAFVGVATSGTGTDVSFPLTGTLVTGGSSGTLQFIWAQLGSSGTATTRRARSRLTLRRIS
jgi:hypothetical protein